MPLLIFLTNFVSPLWAVWELIQEKILRSQRGEKNLLYKSNTKTECQDEISHLPLCRGPLWE